MGIVGKKSGVSVIGKRAYVGIDSYKESCNINLHAEGYRNSSS